MKFELQSRNIILHFNLFTWIICEFTNLAKIPQIDTNSDETRVNKKRIKLLRENPVFISEFSNLGIPEICKNSNKMRTWKFFSIVHIQILSISLSLSQLFVIFAGFSSPLMACCGYGGPPYNYNIQVQCGQPGHQVCNEGSRFVSWDGVHYTEAANAFVTSKILSLNYSTPRIGFNFFCRWWSFIICKFHLS